MSDSLTAGKHQWDSQHSAMKILTAFARRITVGQGVIEIFRQDFFCLAFARRRWISSSICRLTGACFSNCKSLASVTFESDSKLQRIEACAFHVSGLTAIHIPASVEVLCESCFSNCRSLASVTFESDSKLQRIEEHAFYWSGLTAIHVPASVEVLCKSCFADCESLASVTFELDSKLQRIDEYAFQRSGLTAIHVPASVEVLCKYCFSNCESLASVTFESRSKLREVAADTFARSPRLRPIEYPPSLSEWSRALSSSIADDEWPFGQNP
jgi:alkylhydroperoxidase family enzyme